MVSGQVRPDIVSEKDSSVVKSDTLNNKLIMSADKAIYSVSATNNEVDTLIGDVILIQDSVFMSCNYAIVENQINAFASGNVVIIQDDSIYIYADTLRYDGVAKVAILSGEVIMDTKEKRLNTTYLVYDANAKSAVFTNGGTLIENTSQLISREGIYYVEEELAEFKYNVRYKDSVRTILTDSLIYDYARQQIQIISPTRIIEDSTEIYCESGLYSTRSNRGVLSQNVQVSTEGRLITAGILEYSADSSTYMLYINPVIDDNGAIARGDTILFNSETDQLNLIGHASYKSDSQFIVSDRINYDNKTKRYSTTGRSKVYDKSTELTADNIIKNESGETLALGAVMLYDTSSHSTIFCDAVKRIDSLDLSYAYNYNSQPLLVYEMGEGDTLFLRSDTLFSYKVNGKDCFSAYYRAHYVMGDIAGICDSLAYISADSVIMMLGSPFLWSDSVQLKADTIMISLENNQVEEVVLTDHAMIVNQNKASYYDQINGAKINCKIEDGQMSQAFVDGNAEMIYFLLEDDNVLKAVNSTLSSKMIFSFNDNQIDEIRFIKKPESVVNEYYEGMDISPFLLEGFIWNISKRPLITDFIF